MTCIVGLKHDGKVYIGADSLGSTSFSKYVRDDKKVFKLKGSKHALVGFTNSFRMGQLLMYSNELINDKVEVNHEYMVMDFTPRLINMFTDGGFGGADEGGAVGGDFLVGYKDKLFQVHSDYQVGINVDDYMACGSGEYFALGSLASTENIKNKPIKRIKKALEAAEKFSVSVQRPFYIMNTENNEVIEIK